MQRILASVLGVALLGGIARADHERATPRKVVERQLGPLRVGAQLPSAFTGCATSTKGFPEEEYLAFFERPDDPTNSAVLFVNVDCLGKTSQPVPCTERSPRFVKFLSIDARSNKPERIEPRCKLPLAPKQLTTSRGIALGDSIRKVLSRYGPASVHNRLAQQDSPKNFHIVYTKSTDTGEGRELLFRFENRAVIEIMVTMYGEGEADWSKELPSKALQTAFESMTVARAVAPAKKLVLTGTVTSIFQVDAPPPSRRNWGVTIRVEKVKIGKYVEPDFTFAIHSPARAGLKAGHRYTVEATWDGKEYLVKETALIKEEPEKP